MYNQRRNKGRRYSNASNNRYGSESRDRGSDRSNERTADRSSSTNTSTSSSYSSSNNRENRSYNNGGDNRGYRGNDQRRSRNSGGNWGSKNRRVHRSQIAHSMYVSKAEEFKKVEYIPQNTFKDFNLNDALYKNIYARDYVNPTKIQDQAIPEIMNGKDILGIGSTGSGKTAAFLIPMINKAMRNPSERVLIVCPTRELGSQINNEFKKFTQNTNMRMVLVIGGANIRTQMHLLKSRPQFVVGTPGRLLDLIKRNVLDLRTFNNIVLDEVDQMLDMGFVNDIKKIISGLSENRQSLFFSATMSPKEEVIANSLLNNPIKVEADKQSALKTIDQDIIKVTSREHKIETLHVLLKKGEFNKVLVFSSTKREADYISDELRQRGISADSLHGDKPQSKRSKILLNFREDKLDVLIATDVAARGIDIPDISHVINYDEPANYNDYIHRIGRTGRIGKKGTALTFVIGR